MWLSRVFEEAEDKVRPVFPNRYRQKRDDHEATTNDRQRHYRYHARPDGRHIRVHQRSQRRTTYLFKNPVG